MYSMVPDILNEERVLLGVVATSPRSVVSAVLGKLATTKTLWSDPC